MVEDYVVVFVNFVVFGVEDLGEIGFGFFGDCGE